jgi:hypothetical protein
MNQVLSIVGIAAAVAGLLFLFLGIAGFRSRRWLGGLTSTLFGLVGLLLAAMAGLITVGTQGYRALTHEEVVAVVTTVPTGPRAFRATFRMTDGTTPQYNLEGDEIEIDAHILKWKYFGNLLGLTTQYELDRVSGRYASAEDEQSQHRTVHSLSRPKPVDLFHLARRYTPIAYLVDAEYGSGTFTQVTRPAQYEVSVSTTGLVIRKIGEAD